MRLYDGKPLEVGALKMHWYHKTTYETPPGEINSRAREVLVFAIDRWDGTEWRCVAIADSDDPILLAVSQP